MKNFVVVTTQRSGSTWLIDKLNSHPKITAFEGVFMLNSEVGSVTKHGEKGLVKWNTHRLNNKSGINLRPASIYKYLSELYSPSDKSASESRGFKLMYNELMRYPEIFAFLVRRRIHIVHLYRENIFDVIISNHVLKQSGTAHYEDESSRPTGTKIHVDLRTLKSRMYKRWFGFKVICFLLRSLPSSYHSVSYESLCQDEAAFNKIIQFLGYSDEDVALKSSLVKINRSSYEDTVVNFDEVKRVIGSTRFAHMIN